MFPRTLGKASKMVDSCPNPPTFDHNNYYSISQQIERKQCWIIDSTPVVSEWVHLLKGIMGMLTWQKRDHGGLGAYMYISGPLVPTMRQEEPIREDWGPGNWITGYDERCTFWKNRNLDFWNHKIHTPGWFLRWNLNLDFSRQEWYKYIQDSLPGQSVLSTEKHTPRYQHSHLICF